MATFVWKLQGVSDTEIDATDKLQFAGVGGFDSKITVGEYNDTTHVKTAVGGNKSDGNTPNNVKYISLSKADWGDGEEDLNLIEDGEATLLINFANDPAVITEDAIFYAYNGTTPATPPANIDFQAAEVGDINWTNAEGSGSALALDDQGSLLSHDFFIACSASPDTVGAKTGKIRIELTYS